MVLYPEVNGFTYTKIEKSILVKNVNDEPINVSLQVDEKTAEFIELIDKTFILEEGEEKNAEFIVKVKDEGRYDGKIGVFFASTDPEKKTGVALSSTVIVIAKKDQGNNQEEETNEEEGSVETGKTFTETVEGVKSSVLSPVFLIGSVFVLLAILIVLFVMAKRKKSGKRRKKVNGKRSRRKR